MGLNLDNLLHMLGDAGKAVAHALVTPAAHSPLAVAHPAYQPVAQQKGYFRDPNSGTGWSFANGHGGIQTGISQDHLTHANRFIGANGLGNNHRLDPILAQAGIYQFGVNGSPVTAWGQGMNSVHDRPGYHTGAHGELVHGRSDNAQHVLELLGMA